MGKETIFKVKKGPRHADPKYIAGRPRLWSWNLSAGATRCISAIKGSDLFIFNAILQEISFERLKYCCFEWSGQRGSNPRHQAWEACTLPTELCPLIYISYICI